MSAPLLVDFFRALPVDALQGGLDWPDTRTIGNTDRGKKTKAKMGGKARRRAAIHIFCKKVRERYYEGTLLRLLDMERPDCRQAAVFALGLMGTPAVNDALACMLHDPDDEVARLASEALKTLWFRGDNADHSNELHQLFRLGDLQQILQALDELIARAPRFAEAYNQRAMLFARLERFDRAIADCEATLRLNPHQFDAQACLGQCFLRLRKHRPALRAFRTALRINPRLNDIAEKVRELEITLGEEGREGPERKGSGD
jgi:tetratricopeptide (TPR) repeat protein